MVSWRSSATVYTYTYKYQQHLDDTKEVSTGIFQKKVLYRFFKKKFFIMETNGKCMGFKAEIESGHLRNFENSSNIANSGMYLLVD